MSTRSSKRGKLPSSDVFTAPVLSEIKDIPTNNPTTRSRRGKHVDALDMLTEDIEMTVKSNSPRKILNEISDNAVPAAGNFKRRTTRSRKDTQDDGIISKIPIHNVNENQKKKKHRNKEVEAISSIIIDILPIENHSRKTTRSNRNKRSADLDENHLSEETIKVSEPKLEPRKKKTKQLDAGNILEHKSDDQSLPLPSKRGSTGNVVCVEDKNNTNTRRGRSNRNKPTEPEKASQRTTRKNKNVSNPEIHSDKNTSNASNETSYHSVRGSINLATEDKEESSFKSAVGFDGIPAFNHSLTKNMSTNNEIAQSNKRSNSNGFKSNVSLTKSIKDIQMLDDTSPILINDSIDSVKVTPQTNNSTFNKSDQHNSTSMTRSNKILRISGIEEIPTFPPASTSLRRDRTFTLENNDSVHCSTINNSKVFDKSHDDSGVLKNSSRKNVLTAASPCKLFGNSSVANVSVLRTPVQISCRAVSVGSAGRTPMPPPERAASISSQLTTSSKTSNYTPRNSVRILNITHSLEKPVNSSPTQKLGDTKTRGKVIFCDSKQDDESNSNMNKIIKSSMKGSSKSFLFNSVTKPATRKRSLTHSETEASRGKIPRMTEKELNLSASRLSRPKTPKSEVKNKFTPKSKSSTCGSTPAKPLLPPAPLSRGKMPDFASLHRKQFEQMESLTQNKERREQRAKQLLFSSIAPKCLSVPKSNIANDKLAAGDKKDPAVDKNGFTRFGFKLPNEPLKFNMTAGASKVTPAVSHNKTTKAEARQMIMREPQMSVAEKKRKENRDYVKGVRTNRRFELQMKARNLAV